MAILMTSANAALDFYCRRDPEFCRGIRVAYQRYPDIQVVELRNGTLQMVSLSANKDVDQMVIEHNYDECSDSPVVVYPFIDVAGYRVHSLPSAFVVGHHNHQGYGEIADDAGWETMLEIGINDTLIDKVTAYFNGHHPTPVIPG